MKLSTSEAFSDMIFSPSKSPFPKTRYDRRIIDNKRPCSQNNVRPSHSKRLDQAASTPSKDLGKNLESLLTHLVEENKRLKEELENMKKINRSLLESDKLSIEEYRTFYQAILVEHLQKKIENLDEEANYYRTENKKNSLELDYMKRDKKYIRALALKYKNLSVEKSGTRNTAVKQQSALFVSEKPQMRVFEKRIENLNEFIIKLQEQTDFLSILSSLAEFMKKNLKAEKVSMILVSKEMKDLYGRYVKSFFKHNWNDLQVIIAEGPHLSVIEIDNLNIEHVKSGFTSGKDLYSTISFNNEPSIYICLKKKLASKGEFNLFTASDSTYFKLISTCASLALNYIKSHQREVIEISHVSELTNLVSNLINNKNHKELANNIYKFLPKFLEFEAVGIVFVDQLTKEFFLMIPTEGFEDRFSDASIKFPTSLGITGDVYRKNALCRFENLKSHRLFSTEIDNSCRTFNLNNSVFASLSGVDGEIVGVMQVFNKNNGKHVSENDLEKIKSIQRILGICISCTNCISEAASLTINFKHSVHQAMNSIEAIDRSRGSELFEIKNSLSAMKTNMNEWVNQKRQKSIGLN